MNVVSVDLAPTVQAPREARQAIDPLGEEIGAKKLFDLRAVVTELVANAVIHGPKEPILLEVRVEDATIRGEVRDRGNGTAPIRTAITDSRHRGFGLKIVDALVDEWGVFAEGTRVWFKTTVS